LGNGDDTVSTTTDDPTATEPRPYPPITPRYYLVRERAARYKSEYNDGEIVAMGGASRRHSLICTNLMLGLGPQLSGRRCEIHAHDLRVRLDAGRRYVYPDLVVACGDPRFEDDELDVLLNPTVVIEVLSRSTEKKDRGWKLDAYRRVASVRAIVLLSQDAPLAEVFRRDAGGEWEPLLPLRGMDAVLRLESIGCELVLSDIYGGVPGIE
jgi:Uma2 family endonuclease